MVRLLKKKKELWFATLVTCSLSQPRGHDVMLLFLVLSLLCEKLFTKSHSQNIWASPVVLYAISKGIPSNWSLAHHFLTIPGNLSLAHLTNGSLLGSLWFLFLKIHPLQMIFFIYFLFFIFFIFLIYIREQMNWFLILNYRFSWFSQYSGF